MNIHIEWRAKLQKGCCDKSSASSFWRYLFNLGAASIRGSTSIHHYLPSPQWVIVRTTAGQQSQSISAKHYAYVISVLHNLMDTRWRRNEAIKMYFWKLPMCFEKLKFDKNNGVFILEDALSVQTNLGKHSLFLLLFVPSITKGTGRIICLDELSSVVRLERRTTENSLSTRIMRLVLWKLRSTWAAA